MAQLTLLYDGGCPLCLREVRFLEQRDRRLHPDAPRLEFVDIDAADYAPAAHGGIGYREAMGRIHAIAADGTVLRDVAVFRRAYALVGLGWLYAPTGWPLLAPLVNLAYGLWAAARLKLTGRPGIEQLCALRGGRCGGVTGGTASVKDGRSTWESASATRP
jgi:predicted DCC family thiol-disulfide oxidoreductase YuxK